MKKFDQSRRSFIKVVSAGSLMLGLNPFAMVKTDDYLWFDPYQQYGDFVSMIDLDRETMRMALNELFVQVKETIPSRYRRRSVFIIQAPRPFADSYGLRGFLGWKTIPLNQRMPRKRLYDNQ